MMEAYELKFLLYRVAAADTELAGGAVLETRPERNEDAEVHSHALEA